MTLGYGASLAFTNTFWTPHLSIPSVNMLCDCVGYSFNVPSETFFISSQKNPHLCYFFADSIIIYFPLLCRKTRLRFTLKFRGFLSSDSSNSRPVQLSYILRSHLQYDKSLYSDSSFLDMA